MSDITVSRPEVVNGHTDVIGSTSIRHVVTVRYAALQQAEMLIRQLADGETGNGNESHHPEP